MDNYDTIMQVLELNIAYLRMIALQRKRRKRMRRWWSKPHIRNNHIKGYGALTTNFRYFRLQDEEELMSFIRINAQQFMYLHNLVQNRLTKGSWRVPLPAELRLCLTLNYLAHGDSVRKNAWYYEIGLSTVHKVIPEVCAVLCEILAPIFLTFPSEEFKVISNTFNTDSYFPNCIGALDGRHCPITKPNNSGTLFKNYKKFFSIVFMGCCDSNMRFIWANVGDYGSYNDAGVFATSDLGQALANSTVHLPPPVFLPQTNILTPHYFIGDGGFPIKKYFMKPFIHTNNLTIPQRNFNYRLSHARSIIENAFGLLSNTWLINRVALPWSVETNEKIIMSTVCLHNFLLHCKNNVIGRPYNINEVENLNIMPDVSEINDYVNVNGLQAFQIRQNLCNYLPM